MNDGNYTRNINNYIHKIYTLYINYIQTIYALFTHYIHIIYTPYTHYIHTIFTLYAHYMHNICALYTHCTHYYAPKYYIKFIWVIYANNKFLLNILCIYSIYTIRNPRPKHPIIQVNGCQKTWQQNWESDIFTMSTKLPLHTIPWKLYRVLYFSFILHVSFMCIYISIYYINYFL
jgi:hypothetical protein